MSVAPLVDTDRYPIDRPEARAYAHWAAECRHAFREEAVLLLPGFLRADVVAELASEAATLVPQAFFCRNQHNVYLDGVDAARGEDHLRNRLLRTDVGSIANDLIAAGSRLQQLYESDQLIRFIAEVVGVDQLHISADPLGALSINVFAPGDAHAWHFDEARFTVTLMLQPAEVGGHFEYVRGLRDDGDMGDIDSIGRLVGDSSLAGTHMPFEPGTLSVFSGHNTIHRVTRVEGGRPRLVPVLTYSNEPGYRNSDAVRKLFWGRSS